MKKRMIGLLLALALTLGLALPSVAVASASGSYDAYDALLYASEHWNDGKGLCAEFVWNCVEAGGLKLNKSGLDYSWRTTKGAVQGICNAIGKPYTGIADLPNAFTHLGDNNHFPTLDERVGPGDVIIYFSPESNVASHVEICAGGMTAYSHNPAKDSGPIGVGSTLEDVKFLDLSDATLKDCDCVNFYDVRQDDWFHGYVEEVLDKELMNGLSFHSFAPNGTMTRAMLVTVLWRFNLEPDEGENNFTDIKDGQWYTEAVAWAAHNGIVNGTGSGRFDPDGPVTREQLATILYRYTKDRGDDVDARVELSSFPDAGKVSTYAQEALSWAVAKGLVGGTKMGNQTYLDPQGSATRAQVAAILIRYIDACGIVETSGQCGDDLYWELSKSGILTVTGSGSMWDREPRNGTPLWYNQRKYVKKIILPEGLTRIGYNAFFGCSGVSEVTIPQTVTSVGEAAFSDTRFAKENRAGGLLYCDGWLLEADYLLQSEITVAEGTKGLADGAFGNCNLVEFIHVPDSVIYIGIGAFVYCPHLKDVRLPSNLEEISERLFCDSHQIKTLTIPANVKRIGKDAFKNCYFLEGLYFLGNAPELDVQAIPLDTVLYYVEGAQGWMSPYWNGYQTQLWEP